VACIRVLEIGAIVAPAGRDIADTGYHSAQTRVGLEAVSVRSYVSALHPGKPRLVDGAGGAGAVYRSSPPDRRPVCLAPS
jgi:hypothetical protein